MLTTAPLQKFQFKALIEVLEFLNEFATPLRAATNEFANIAERPLWSISQSKGWMRPLNFLYFAIHFISGLGGQ